MVKSVRLARRVQQARRAIQDPLALLALWVQKARKAYKVKPERSAQ